jgi:hypothetical protein
MTQFEKEKSKRRLTDVKGDVHETLARLRKENAMLSLQLKQVRRFAFTACVHVVLCVCIYAYVRVRESMYVYFSTQTLTFQKGRFHCFNFFLGHNLV